ncbi:DegT/DnrJ/EryC1/StrS family aminotransferase [uncultured Flavobacterium sp.]|uniref:DegT/DnrJ/EryC1/StrS family aminotransferase n=1 Tax=uncultured Flavobacterium sp. TaxID=165435 RepID=UPI0025D21676|nr:DegT/DnrJ/EryC1/StrS family aminotransferase [uncultured Flavobacterium sp.]
MKEENSKIWLSSPHMSGKEMIYINEAFETNWIAPVGSNISGFEHDLEEYFKNNHVAVLNSGSAALHLGLILLGIKSGDEVLVQTHTHIASVNPVLYLGATPIFIDSEKDTWNICPKTLEMAIQDRIEKGKKPKAIIAVELYGMPYKYDEIKVISEKYQIPILEDSAEALGSTYKNQKCGTLGDISILSFNGNKIITTSGGGAIVSKNKEIKDKAIFLSTQARDAAPHYQHSEIGFNYRMSNISAGIGRGQMQVLEERILQRRKMNQFYKDFFSEIEGVTVFSESNEDFFSNHWLSAILIDSSKTGGKSREDLRLALEAENIESRPIWKPMHLQPVFQDYPYYGGSVSETIFKNGLCLPSGSNLLDIDKKRIKKVLHNFFEK